MAYIRKMKNREGREYVYLAEGYRVGDKVRSRILKKYGPLDKLEEKEPGAYERLKREAKAGLLQEEFKSEIEVTYNLNEEIKMLEENYGWQVLDGLFEGLEISRFIKKTKQSRSKIPLVEALKLLTYQRILDPSSKLNTIKSQEYLYGNWQLDEHTIYRSLDEINQIKEALQLHLHQQITEKIGRVATLIFYDVTNYYFETDIDDPNIEDEEGQIIEQGFRKRGASKEHRPNPIVQLGLFIDTNGIPISYQLFKGNQTDPITYLPAIDQVKKQFGLERIVVVADKAMNSKRNLTETLAQGDGWLFSQKHRGKRGAPKEIQDFILNPNGWEFNHEMTFAKKSMIRERKLEKQQIVKEKVLVTWNKKYAIREKIRRDGAIEYAQKLTDAELFRSTAKRGGKKYLELKIIDKETGEEQPFFPIIELNQEAIDFDSQFDGINVLVTSEITLSDEEILTHYKELSRIEDCFRVTKTELNSRPIFVWTKEHIEAHFLTCFMALTFLRIIQHVTNWELSPQRIIEPLNSAKAIKLNQGYYQVQANPDLIRIQELLGIDWHNRIVKVEKLNKYGKSWFTTLKK